MIEITMSEVATYKGTFTRERVAELLDLSEDTTADCLAAILNNDYDEAMKLGLDDEVFMRVRENLDGAPLDTMLNHFAFVDDRDFSAEVAE